MFYPIDKEEYDLKIKTNEWQIFRWPKSMENYLKSMTNHMLPKNVPDFAFIP